MVLHTCFHCILVFLDTCEEGRASGINFGQSFPTLDKSKSMLLLEQLLPWEMEGYRDQAWILLLGQLSCWTSHRFRFFWKALIGMSTIVSPVESCWNEMLNALLANQTLRKPWQGGILSSSSSPLPSAVPLNAHSFSADGRRGSVQSVSCEEKRAQ